MTTYSGFFIGPKLKRAEVNALAETVPDLERSWSWFNGSVQQRRFIGRPFWTRDGDKIVKSESSWCRWIEEEEGRGFDFMKLPALNASPLIASLNVGGRLTIWDGVHRIAFCIANNIDPLHVRVAIEGG